MSEKVEIPEDLKSICSRLIRHRPLTAAETWTLIERIASLEDELANTRAIASGVTHHDACWRQSPEYARMVAENERLKAPVAFVRRDVHLDVYHTYEVHSCWMDGLIITSGGREHCEEKAAAINTIIASRAHKVTPKPAAPSQTAQTTPDISAGSQAEAANKRPPASSTE